MENKKNTKKITKQKPIKTYEIEIKLENVIEGLKDNLNFLEEDYLEELDEYEECKKLLKLAKELTAKPYKVKTFEDYYKLLTKIDTITEGDYKIFNNGVYITDSYY